MFYNSFDLVIVAQLSYAVSNCVLCSVYFRQYCWDWVENAAETVVLIGWV